MQELDPKLGFDLIKQFKNLVNKVVGAVKNGIDAIRNIVNADFSLKDVVDEFVASVKAIPQKVQSSLIFKINHRILSMLSCASVISVTFLNKNSRKLDFCEKRVVQRLVVSYWNHL